MDNNVFPERSDKIPGLYAELTSRELFDQLSPGEIVDVVPVGLGAALPDGKIYLNKQVVNNREAVSRRPENGPEILRVIFDFDGIYIDATAVPNEALRLLLKPQEPVSELGVVGHMKPEFKEVKGVIYPFVGTALGLSHQAVEDFNNEQLATRERFAKYFQSTYGRNYNFADQDMGSAVRRQRRKPPKGFLKNFLN